MRSSPGFCTVICATQPHEVSARLANACGALAVSRLLCSSEFPTLAGAQSLSRQRQPPPRAARGPAAEPSALGHDAPPGPPTCWRWPSIARAARADGDSPGRRRPSASRGSNCCASMPSRRWRPAGRLWSRARRNRRRSGAAAGRTQRAVGGASGAAARLEAAGIRGRGSLAVRSAGVAHRDHGRVPVSTTTRTIRPSCARPRSATSRASPRPAARRDASCCSGSSPGRHGELREDTVARGSVASLRARYSSRLVVARGPAGLAVLGACAEVIAANDEYCRGILVGLARADRAAAALLARPQRLRSCAASLPGVAYSPMPQRRGSAGKCRTRRPSRSIAERFRDAGRSLGLRA